MVIFLSQNIGEKEENREHLYRKRVRGKNTLFLEKMYEYDQKLYLFIQTSCNSAVIGQSILKF